MEKKESKEHAIGPVEHRMCIEGIIIINLTLTEIDSI